MEYFSKFTKGILTFRTTFFHRRPQQKIMQKLIRYRQRLITYNKDNETNHFTHQISIDSQFGKRVSNVFGNCLSLSTGASLNASLNKFLLEIVWIFAMATQSFIVWWPANSFNVNNCVLPWSLRNTAGSLLVFQSTEKLLKLVDTRWEKGRMKKKKWNCHLFRSS